MHYNESKRAAFFYQHHAYVRMEYRKISQWLLIGKQKSQEVIIYLKVRSTAFATILQSVEYYEMFLKFH